MERLIANDLIYGGLMPVTKPHMVARYNQALELLNTRPTSLSSFTVDATGYSPEVAEDLGDPNYLDPHGVNRRFIILSPEQGRRPVVHLNFSSTSELVRTFYEKNMDALKTLTLKDVVYGEIENSTYRVSELDDILSIKSIEFRVKTASGLLQQAAELNGLVERFNEDSDGWRDDALLTRMAELAAVVGDVRTNKLVPRHVQFRQKSFWTRHFGGLYVFHDDNDDPVVVGAAGGADAAREQMALSRYISFEAPNEIIDYLLGSGRLEPMNYEWLHKSRVLEHRENVYVRGAIAAAHPELDVDELNDAWIRNWVNENYDGLAEGGVFPALLKLRKLVHNRQTVPKKLVGTEHHFMLVRAMPEHYEQRLVNRLISEFVPFDYLMRFIYNKEAFYADYEAFNESLREFVVNMITTMYFPDKAALRRRLYQ